jgi:hypothetical protein
MTPCGGVVEVQQRSRPVGVTVLVILAGFMSVIEIVGSFLGLSATGFTAIFLGDFVGLFGDLFLVIPIVVGIVGIFVAYGLWGLKSWAWVWTFLWIVLSIILSIFSGDLLSAGIESVLLVYLWIVREHFQIAK